MVWPGLVCFAQTWGADAKSLEEIEARFSGKEKDGAEISYRRKDGSVFCAAIFVSPVLDKSNAIVEHFASFVDLSRQKQEQARSTSMIHELNHRVKNTLATVQSIVRQALRKISDPDAMKHYIESRLFALGRSHDLLTRESWHGAGLFDLVNEAMKPFGVENGHTERFVITARISAFCPIPSSPSASRCMNLRPMR